MKKKVTGTLLILCLDLTSTTPPPEEPNYLRLAIILSAILTLVILTVIFNKRRSREPRYRN